MKMQKLLMAISFLSLLGAVNLSNVLTEILQTANNNEWNVLDCFAVSLFLKFIFSVVVVKAYKIIKEIFEKDE